MSIEPKEELKIVICSKLWKAFGSLMRHQKHMHHRTQNFPRPHCHFIGVTFKLAQAANKIRAGKGPWWSLQTSKKGPPSNLTTKLCLKKHPSTNNRFKQRSFWINSVCLSKTLPKVQNQWVDKTFSCLMSPEKQEQSKSTQLNFALGTYSQVGFSTQR